MKMQFDLDMVVPSSFSGGRDQEFSFSKKLARPHLNQQAGCGGLQL
jgi:hypothetical protein